MGGWGGVCGKVGFRSRCCRSIAAMQQEKHSRLRFNYLYHGSMARSAKKRWPPQSSIILIPPPTKSSPVPRNLIQLSPKPPSPQIHPPSAEGWSSGGTDRPGGGGGEGDALSVNVKIGSPFPNDPARCLSRGPLGDGGRGGGGGWRIGRDVVR